MLRGAAETFCNSLVLLVSALQHAQHEKGRFLPGPTHEFACAVSQLTLAGELGFEPRFSESESDVLPLNYSPAGQEAIVLHRQPGGRLSHGAISLI